MSGGDSEDGDGDERSDQLYVFTRMYSSDIFMYGSLLLSDLIEHIDLSR